MLVSVRCCSPSTGARSSASPSFLMPTRWSLARAQPSPARRRTAMAASRESRQTRRLSTDCKRRRACRRRCGASSCSPLEVAAALAQAAAVAQAAAAAQQQQQARRPSTISSQGCRRRRRRGSSTCDSAAEAAAAKQATAQALNARAVQRRLLGAPGAEGRRRGAAEQSAEQRELRHATADGRPCGPAARPLVAGAPAVRDDLRRLDPQLDGNRAKLDENNTRLRIATNAMRSSTCMIRPMLAVVCMLFVGTFPMMKVAEATARASCARTSLQP